MDFYTVATLLQQTGTLVLKSTDRADCYRILQIANHSLQLYEHHYNRCIDESYLSARSRLALNLFEFMTPLNILRSHRPKKGSESTIKKISNHCLNFSGVALDIINVKKRICSDDATLESFSIFSSIFSPLNLAVDCASIHMEVELASVLTSFRIGGIFLNTVDASKNLYKQFKSNSANNKNLRRALYMQISAVAELFGVAAPVIFKISPKTKFKISILYKSVKLICGFARYCC